MADYAYYGEQSDLLLTENEKLGDKYLECQIDMIINASNSISRERVRDAYDAMRGRMNKKDYEYLWAAYGIESAATIRNIPALRSIFESLIGSFLAQPFKWRITATDTDSVKYMMQDQMKAVFREINQHYRNLIRMAQYSVDQGGDLAGRAKLFINDLKKRMDSGEFISDLEVDADNMMQWCLKRFDVQNLCKDYAESMIGCGEGIFQAKVEQIGMAPLIRVHNPGNVFYVKTSAQKWISESSQIRIREYMTVVDVWMKFGHFMKKEDQDAFLEKYRDYIIGTEWEIVGYDPNLGTFEGDRIDRDKSVNSMSQDLIEVNYVEWKSNIKVPYEELTEDEVGGELGLESRSISKIENRKTKYKYRLDLFSGYRIGNSAGIYVKAGREKFVVRDPDNPSYVPLTIDGNCYNDMNGVPYSLPLKMQDIQKSINVLFYHAEALVAASGVKAINVDFAEIPDWMGDKPETRVMRWLGYVKQGLAMKNSAQDGANKSQNTTMTSQDMTISQGIETIYNMIDRLISLGHQIAGVSRQSVGNITQSDGKGTSEIAIQGSEIVQKPLFFAINLGVARFITNIVNSARIAYKEGIQGALILGPDQRRLFSIKSDKFKLAHLNVWPDGMGDTERDADAVRQLGMQLVENQLIDVNGALDMVTIKSLTELKRRIKQGADDLKNGQISDLTAQVQQLQQQAEMANKELQKLQLQDAQGRKLELEYQRQKDSRDLDIKDKKVSGDIVNNAAKVDIDSKKADLEALQLQYTHGRAQEIRNN